MNHYIVMWTNVPRWRFINAAINVLILSPVITAIATKAISK